MFSIIIPAHDSAATIEAALDSVRAQTFADYEVIVVDDASADGSADLASGHPVCCRVIVLPQCSGPGVARNAGARVAKGDYLAFLDADDEWFPWTLATLAEAVARTNHPSLVCGTAVRGTHREKDAELPPEAPVIEGHANYFSTSDRHVWINAGGVAIERDAFLRAGGFAEWNANAEDSDLWLRLGSSPGFAEIKSPPLFFYRATPGSLTRRPERIAPGYLNLVHAEKAGLYPGGMEAAGERRAILTRHTRAGSLTLLALGRRREAIALYAATFRWNLAQRRFRYLAGFWLRALR